MSNLPRLRSNAYAHLNSAKPVATAGAGAGTSPTITNTGADERGQVSVTVGTSPAAGTLVTLAFAHPYSVAPDAVIVSANDSTTAASGVYYASATNTTLTIGTHATTPAGALKLHYVVVGGV
jgi:hypothetical protein